MRYIFTSLLLITLFASCLTVKRGPEKDFEQVELNDVVFDAVIVPGIPFENGHWDSIMKARVIWSYVLYKNGITKNIIYSGSAVYSPYYESKIMGLYAQELGIPKEHIYYDTQARHSTENAYYSYIVAKNAGFKTLALTSDPLQSALLRRFTKARFGTQIYHMPFVMDSVRRYNHLNPEIDPTPASVQEFVSIMEQESPRERFMGTMGKGINWKEHKGKRLPPL